VPGDYHYIALTSSGKALTWGVSDKGALGLGDPATLTRGAPGAFPVHGFGPPPDVEAPTEVRFDHGRKSPKDRYCFSVAAAGWHTGALVIDLEVCYRPVYLVQRLKWLYMFSLITMTLLMKKS
jgi:SCF-associated factor 1